MTKLPQDFTDLLIELCEAKAEFSSEARRGGSTNVGGSASHVPAPLTRVPGAVEMPEAMQAQLKRKPKGDL